MYWAHRRRLGLASLAFFQNSLVGGILYGWASIDRSLLTAPPTLGGAGLTQSQTTEIFSWAASTAMLSSLVLGVVLDRLGPRMCSFAANFVIALGFLVFAVAQSFEWYALGACLISFGGPGIQASIVHVANLFPDNRFLMLGGMNGCISLSFAVFGIFDLLWETFPKLSVRVLFGSYFLLVSLSAMASLSWWPDYPFEPDDDDVALLQPDPTPEDEYIQGMTMHQHLLEQPLDSFLRADYHRRPSYLLSRMGMEHGDASLVSLKDQPFWKQLGSGAYLRAFLFLLVTCFLANFYVGSFTTELADSQYFPSSDQRTLAHLFTFIISFGVLASILAGWLMDRVGLEACTALTILMGQLQGIILLFFGNCRPLLILSFVLYGSFRQFLFPVFIATLIHQFGFKYFGLLSGIAFAVSGISQSLLASLVEMTEGTCHLHESPERETCSVGHWKALHAIEIAALMLLMIVPAAEYKDRKRRHKLIDDNLRLRLSDGYGTIVH